VLQYTRLERQAKGKHSSLLGPIISYEEDKVFVNFILDLLIGMPNEFIFIEQSSSTLFHKTFYGRNSQL
jgi:hypothetical protein